MTPQLRQAIGLLQMSNVELTEHLAEELEKNPLLEVVEPDGEAVLVEASINQISDDAEDGAPAENVEAEKTMFEAPLYEPALSNATDDYDVLQHIEYKQSLREKLREQIQISDKNPLRTNIAMALIDELDERGWLVEPLFEISDRLGVSQTSVEAALTVLQGCDPVGIGARNLQECLEIQLQDMEEFTPIMQVLTANLEVLAANDLPRLEILADVERDELNGAIARLRLLNPRPALGFTTDTVQTAIADVNVNESMGGGWNVELNADTLPKALVNETYYSQVTKDGSAATEFIAECHANAKFLVKAMDQRAKTILRVATVIVRHQNRFFDEGIAGLRPLTLAAVASELEIHESTVSRVTSNKYLYCLRGTFELRFFFVQGISRNDGGSDVAAPVVRERIRALVAKESPTKVLSDEKIAKTLQKEGVVVARRTVAKYREAMGIPSSSRRRRMHT